MCALDSISSNFNIYNPSFSRDNRRSSSIHRSVAMDETPDPTKTLATAGILQLAAMSLMKISKLCGDKLMAGKEFTSAENVKTIAQNMVSTNKLDVHVGYLDKHNVESYIKQLGQNSANDLIDVAKGKNAFYSDVNKLAVAPKNKPSLMLHELGHAVNATKGRFMKLLQNSRRYAIAAPAVLLALNALIPDKNDNPNFIERNAGKLGFLAFLPTVVEEGIASIRGINAAKTAQQTLGKLNLKPLMKNYGFAWMTYLLSGIGLGIAAKQAFVESKVHRQ